MTGVSDEIRAVLDEIAALGRIEMESRLVLEGKREVDDMRYALAVGRVVNYGRDRGGHSKHKLYSVWNNMIKRCYDPDHDKFKYYGGRGVSVCDEWFNFLTFFEWAAPIWGKELQLDKDILKKGNIIYCPEYCQFVTRSENNKHRRTIKKSAIK